MTDFGEESAKFNTKSLADQAKIILKKGLFSELEILEICEQEPQSEWERKAKSWTSTWTLLKNWKDQRKNQDHSDYSTANIC